MMFEEESKAVQEVAKTTGQAIGALERVGAFLGKVAGDACMELGGMFADQAKMWRYRNLLRLVDKFDAIHEQRRIEGKKLVFIPPAQLFPLLEKATLEDADIVQDLWAGLLANATDGTRETEAKKVFTNILAELEPLDALVMQHLRKTTPGGSSSNSSFGIFHAIGVPHDDIKLSIGNLHRLGCVVEIKTPTLEDLNVLSSGLDVNKVYKNSSPYYMLTHLGTALMEACKVD